MAHDVFISYSTKDKAIADAVCAKLEEKDIRAWIAPRDVPPGTNFAEAIVNAIRDSKVFVLIWSGNANNSKHILIEINRAFDGGIPIIPFRIQEVQPSSAMSYYLSNTHWLDAYQPSWMAHIDKLTHIIKANLGTQDDSVGSQQQEADLEIPSRRKLSWKTVLFALGAVLTLLVVWIGLVKLDLFDSISGKPTQTTKEPTQRTQIVSSMETPSSPILTSTTEATATATEEKNTCQILFQSNRDGEMNLWLIEPDGTNPTQLTFSQESDFVGSWSPDGKELIFSSNRDGNSEVFIMNVNGSNIRQLTDNDSNDVMPRLSPDGTRIAFYSDRTGQYQVYLMDWDGENPTQLTTTAGWFEYQDYGYIMASLDWSPNGQRLAFISDNEGNPNLYIFPDVEAAVEGVLLGQSDMDFIDWDASSDNEGSWELEPAFSPHGQLVYVSDRYGDFEIFLYNFEGNKISQLTSNNGTSSQPTWSPTGNKIAFTSNRTGDPEIWIMDADGSNQQQITDSEGYDGAPVWSPFCWQY